MSRLSSTLVATSMLVVVTGFAIAQEPTYDPVQLPAIQGTIAQYTLTPDGDVDGLILEDGLEVRVSPHVTAELVFAARPGDRVTIRGLRARVAPMMLAMSVTNDATHVTVVTERMHRPRDRDDDAPIVAQGRIKAQLHDTDGETDGVLLQDGTVVRLPTPEAQRLGAQLAIGQTIYASGTGDASVLGRVVAANLLGPTKTTTKPINGPDEDHDRGDRGGRHDGSRHRGHRGSDDDGGDR